MLNQYSSRVRFVDLICSYLHGRGGNSPTKTDIGNAQALKSALANWNAALLAVKPPAAKSIVRATDSVLKQILELTLGGDPNDDWIAVRKVLAKGDCARLKAIAKDVRNVPHR
ncbi:hypothetical protein [Rhizobium leguminosarum]|uniref:hypothetical protein n=1 Tax=Rhizobium leguminosarum TaxID=384 RepID=UPI001C945803|nr:hypothetical protein [Rhizobium leguminosarum]MBY5386056.1 hypothetical protein [Rhizobium leguminosarum]